MDLRSASSINSRNAMRVVGAGDGVSSGGGILVVHRGVDAGFFTLPWVFLLLGLMMCWQGCWACSVGSEG